MQKRSKNKDIIKPNLTVSMKADRLEIQRIKMLKSQLLSEKKCLEKRQSEIEDIIKEVDFKSDVVYIEGY